MGTHCLNIEYMVSRVGLEPTATGLKGRCSTKLSYRLAPQRLLSKTAVATADYTMSPPRLSNTTNAASIHLRLNRHIGNVQSCSCTYIVILILILIGLSTLTLSRRERKCVHHELASLIG